MRELVMHDYLKCTICKESDHEGKACRCEMRNIRVAKEARRIGESPWNKMLQEKMKKITDLFSGPGKPK